MKPAQAERAKQAAAYGYMIIVSALMLLPFAVTVLRSITVQLPGGGTTYGFDPYFEIIGQFWPKIYLSLSIALATIVIDILIAVPAAYALVRYNFRMKKTLFTLLNGVWYVPGVAALR